jgi:glycosyltransferase involved in cell wall biosynthesis
MNVCNGAATLRAAIESVLGQGFGDWELIVWDDCSTDASARIVAEFSDPRIHYFLGTEKLSLGEARNAAIAKARGEWLAFLDQDDVLLPRKLEFQLALTGSPQVGLVYGRTIAFFPDGSERDCDLFHEFTPLPEGDILEELLGRGCFPAMSSVLLRRAAVLAAGRIPHRIRITPDYFLYLSVCSNLQARAVQQVVCRYRVHAKSMTQRYRLEALEEALTLVDDWKQAIPPAVYRRRRTRIATALAFQEIGTHERFRTGLVRLWREGSRSWLAGRPFVHWWRRTRRRIWTPYWKKPAAGS